MGNRATSILGLWVLGSTLLGLMIGHQFIYRQLVLPRLSEFVSIPISWWAIVLSPLSLLWLSTGFAVQSFKQSLLAASVGATVVQGYLGACTVLHQPGFTKSLATEAPGLFWFQGTIVVWVVIVFFVTMGLLAKKLWGQHSP
mgnify:CR=1 FL=1